MSVLDDKIISEEISDVELEEYSTLKQDLEFVEGIKADGTRVRSRIEQIELNEKSNKYFLGQERETYKKKTIGKLVNDSETITDSKLILKQIQSFYETLYSTKLNTDQQIYLEKFVESTENLPTLSEEKQKLCEGNVTLQECFDCLKYFKNNKSPGCDGWSIEFYKKFWKEIGPKLVETLNYSKKCGKMSLSQRRAVLTLLHKKGKDEFKIKNWRPISLLNIVYKIMTKVLAKRMEKVIKDLIHPNQSGFIKGRFIGESIRFLRRFDQVY